MEHAKNVTVPECCSIVGKKKWMRLHFPSFLHCTTKPNQTIIIVVIVVSKPSSLPKPCTGIYFEVVKSRNLRTLGKKMSGLFQLTLPVPEDLHLCPDLMYEDVVQLGRGGVSHVRPGLGGAISVLLCPVSTTAMCCIPVCTCLYCTVNTAQAHI